MRFCLDRLQQINADPSGNTPVNVPSPPPPPLLASARVTLRCRCPCPSPCSPPSTSPTSLPCSPRCNLLITPRRTCLTPRSSPPSSQHLAPTRRSACLVRLKSAHRPVGCKNLTITAFDCIQLHLTATACDCRCRRRARLPRCTLVREQWQRQSCTEPGLLMAS
jgi:hypothetical protein